MTALEIGAGHGIRTMLLTKMFKKVIATEPNEKLCQKFREQGELNDVEIHTVDCESMNMDKKDFDFVITTQSFLWVDNKQQALLNISNHLKKGGYFLVIEPQEFLDFSTDRVDPEILTRMMEVLNVCIRNEKLFQLIHIFPTTVYEIIYLFKRL